MGSPGAMSCVANFVAFAIIADIDNYLYDSWNTPEKKLMDNDELLEDLLKIHHTTSKRCALDEMTDVDDPDINE